MQNRHWANSTVGASSKDSIKERIKVYDGFSTPRIAVETLLQKEAVAEYVWEPAAGFLKIANVLKQNGNKVYTSDIYDWHEGIDKIKNFAKYEQPPSIFNGKLFDIVTNPPFSKAEMFARRALQLLPKDGRLYLLLRLQFLEGQKRFKFFKQFPPQTVYVYSFRLPRMHRFLHKGKKSTSVLCFAWFVWSKGFKGETKVRWLNKLTGAK